MKTHTIDKVWRVLFVLIFVMGTAWTPAISVKADGTTRNLPEQLDNSGTATKIKGDLGISQRVSRSDLHPKTSKHFDVDINMIGAKLLQAIDIGISAVKRTLKLLAPLYAPPTNDDFNAPIVIGDILEYTNTQTDVAEATTASDDPVFSCSSAGKAFQTVWYRYMADATETITVDTIGSNYDTILAVWTGSRGSLVEITCNDDIDLGGGIYQSQLVFDAIEGETYFIEVASWESDADTLILNTAGYSLPTECTSGLCVIVNDSLGNPVPGA